MRRGADWLILLVAGLLIVGGGWSIVTAVQANLEAEHNRQVFADSGARQRAEQAVAEPTPIWVPSGSAAATAVPISSAAAFSAPPPPPTVMALAQTPTAPVPALEATPVAGLAAANWGDVMAIDAGFTFLDPPQPGAHARVWMHIAVPGPQAGAFVLGLPLNWLEGHRVASTTPPAASSTVAGGERRLLFTNLPPGTGMVSVDVVSTAEGVTPPVVRVEQVGSGRIVGEAHPQTVAPRPNPGPVSVLRIDKIGLDVAVVPTQWEPPPFIVGQLKDSADVTEGNTVLVGHLTGAAGAVFNQLDSLSPGDSVVAVSRGVDYDFVVSDKQVLPYDNSAPVADDSASASPKLTLMTCTGTWDPLTHTYSDRLWVTAELPGAAAQTIAANALRPTPTPDGDADPSSVVAQIGLGAERAAFDAALGPPLGETAGKLVVYRQGASEYHVKFSPEPARAEVIEILPLDVSADLTIPTAVTRSRAAFPSDAMPLAEGPEQAGDLVVERFTSPALGTLLGTSSRGGSQPGDFLSEYVRDAQGKVTRVIVASGGDPAAARVDAGQ